MDGSLPKMCPAIRPFDQDGPHSAVALLLKAALIQVGDYRLLGASGSRIYSVILDAVIDHRKLVLFISIEYKSMIMMIKFIL